MQEPIISYPPEGGLPSVSPCELADVEAFDQHCPSQERRQQHRDQGHHESRNGWPHWDQVYHESRNGWPHWHQGHHDSKEWMTAYTVLKENDEWWHFERPDSALRILFKATNDACVRSIRSFLLAKYLSSNGLILKQSVMPQWFPVYSVMPQWFPVYSVMPHFALT